TLWPQGPPLLRRRSRAPTLRPCRTRSRALGEERERGDSVRLQRYPGPGLVPCTSTEEQVRGCVAGVRAARGGAVIGSGLPCGLHGEFFVVRLNDGEDAHPEQSGINKGQRREKIQRDLQR